MRWLFFCLLLALGVLQYKLWFGEDSIQAWVNIKQKAQAQSALNQTQMDKNEQLLNEIKALKSGANAIEEEARQNLGLVKPDEVFFKVIETNPKKE